MKKKYYANKAMNVTDADMKENPWDLLNDTPLLTQDCAFSDIYEVDIKSKAVISKLSLKDFVDDGIDVIKREAKNDGSSGNWAQIGSSGDDARIGSSGDDAQIGSSGDWARIGSSGDDARIGSSGDNARIGSSGDDAQIGSSGNWARIGSSGNWARIGSSGDDARIGSSGNWAQIGSSGNWAQIGSSGDDARIEAVGENNVVFACGKYSCIKAKKGAWISLAEYDSEGAPCFALSAQIGSEEYRDFQGKTLSKEHFYTLCHKQFVKIKHVDGYTMVIFSEKKTGQLTVYKTQYFEDYANGKKTMQYVVENDKLTAHGDTVKQAVADLQFKIMQSMDVSEHVHRVKESGYITPTDYRLLTGACESGTNRWLTDNGFTWDDKKTIAEVVELTRGAYGHERLVELLGEKK